MKKNRLFVIVHIVTILLSLGVLAVAISSEVKDALGLTAIITLSTLAMLSAASIFLIKPFRQLLITDNYIEAERYKIIIEQTDAIVFDYNIKNSGIFLNSNFEKKFGYSINTDKRLNVLLEEQGYVHKEDIGYLLDRQKIDCLKEGVDIRIIKKNGEYIWCNIRATVFRDKKGIPIRVIGKIKDVDSVKKEKEMLIEKTKLDVMTGFYNKGATETLINEVLQKSNESSICALLVLDIDNFKYVNDEFGHISGDNVLSKIAKNLKMTFRATDILGRVGGDEFVIFIRDLPSVKHAIDKAENVLSIIYNSFTIENSGFIVSASIGISLFSRDGSEYATLFEKADKALYISKRAGKNTFTVYKDDDGGGTKNPVAAQKFFYM